MMIRRLNIFMTVTETWKMSLTISKIYIFQPTVNKVFTELEEYYGIKLFE